MHFWGLSFFRSILHPVLFKTVLTLYSIILIKHVLRRCFVHHEPLSAVIVICLMLSFILIWIWLLLIQCMHDSCMLILMLIIILCKCLIYQNVLLPLSKISILLVHIRILIGALLRSTCWSLPRLLGRNLDRLTVILSMNSYSRVHQILFVYKS